MFLRISSALGLLAATAACGGAEMSPPPPGAEVDCAIGAGADFSPVCTLELVEAGDELVIHHPDGGFRRFSRVAETGALVPLDGAEPLVPEPGVADAGSFAVGADRYRIPQALLTPPAP